MVQDLGKLELKCAFFSNGYMDAISGGMKLLVKSSKGTRRAKSQGYRALDPLALAYHLEDRASSDDQVR